MQYLCVTVYFVKIAMSQLFNPYIILLFLKLTHEGIQGELQSWERQKLREEIISSHLKGLEYKKISKKCNIPRDTIGSIIRKFKTYGTAANLPGRGKRAQHFIKFPEQLSQNN